MEQLKGKIALVTGGGAGIGAACSRELASRGAIVVVADLLKPAADGVVAEITALEGAASAAQVDVCDADALVALVAAIVSEFGGLDIAVNNAGISAEQLPVADLTPQLWRKTLDVNLDGVFYSMRAEIPAMSARGGGSIINMGSILSSIAWPNAAAYTTSKHGVLGLTRSAALDYAAAGIRVNAVGPAYVATEMTQRNIAAGNVNEAQIKARIPLGRLAQPADVADAVSFLIGEHASFITGHSLYVDGGWLAYGYF